MPSPGHIVSPRPSRGRVDRARAVVAVVAPADPCLVQAAFAAAAVLLALAAAACPGRPTSDAGVADAGAVDDAGARDDGGVLVDSGKPPGGFLGRDAGVGDAGHDAGMLDGGDAGAEDGGGDGGPPPPPVVRLVPLVGPDVEELAVVQPLAGASGSGDALLVAGRASIGATLGDPPASLGAPGAVAFIAAVDGDVAWVLRVDGAAAAYVHDLAPLVDGGFAFVGEVDRRTGAAGPTSFGPDAGACPDERSRDGYVARAGDDGALAWARCFSDRDPLRGAAVVAVRALGDGTLIVLGTAVGDRLWTSTSADRADELHVDGGPRGGGGALDGGAANDGGANDGGANDGGVVMPHVAGAGSVFVARLAPDGDVLWLLRLGAATRRGVGLDVDGDGTIIVAGLADGMHRFVDRAGVATTLQGWPTDSLFLLRLDADGRGLGLVEGGGSFARDRGGDVAILHDGRVVVVTAAEHPASLADGTVVDAPRWAVAQVFDADLAPVDAVVVPWATGVADVEPDGAGGVLVSGAGTDGPVADGFPDDEAHAFLAHVDADGVVAWTARARGATWARGGRARRGDDGAIGWATTFAATTGALVLDGDGGVVPATGGLDGAAVVLPPP